MTLPTRRLRRIAAAAVATAALLVPAAPALAGTTPPPKDSFIDQGFSDFLTAQCGYPVTVTLTEHDTVVQSNGVFVGGVHITGTVVGNDALLRLRTDSTFVAQRNRATSAGLLVKVDDAAGRPLTKIVGQMAILTDGTTVTHGQFPEFSLCQYLG
jgi:hypothetical protein